MVDHVVEVAKAVAATEGRAWSSLSVEEQARYTVMAQEAITAYLAAVADSRTA